MGFGPTTTFRSNNIKINIERQAASNRDYTREITQYTIEESLASILVLQILYPSEQGLTMAQGLLKKTTSKSRSTANPQKTKKGLRSIPPKRTALVKQARITKVWPPTFPSPKLLPSLIPRPPPMLTPDTNRNIAQD